MSKAMVLRGEIKLGPAMQALTELQRAFVIAYIETGGRNGMRAYLAAYPNCTSKGSAGVTASRFLHQENILAAVREEADRRLQSGALLAAEVIMEIADNPTHKDRFKAAVELLNRAGLIVATHHKVTVEDKRTDAEILSNIKRLAEKLKIDPGDLLGQSEPIEDAEYEEISTEGLEDLL